MLFYFRRKTGLNIGSEYRVRSEFGVEFQAVYRPEMASVSIRSPVHAVEIKHINLPSADEE